MKNSNNSKYSRRTTMKAILITFAVGLVYFVVAVNYLATCITL
jgi:hypothetical protein